MQNISKCPICSLPIEIIEDDDNHVMFYCDNCKYVIVNKDSSGILLYPDISSPGLIAGYLAHEKFSRIELNQNKIDEIMRDPRLPLNPTDFPIQILLYLYPCGCQFSRGIKIDAFDCMDVYIDNDDELKRVCENLIELGYIEIFQDNMDSDFSEDCTSYYVLTQFGLDFVKNKVIPYETLRILKKMAENSGNLLSYIHIPKLITMCTHIMISDTWDSFLLELNDKCLLELKYLPTMPVSEGMVKITSTGIRYIREFTLSQTNTSNVPLSPTYIQTYIENNGGTNINAENGSVVIVDSHSLQEGLQIIKNQNPSEETLIILNEIEDIAKSSERKDSKSRKITDKIKELLPTYGSLVLDALNLILQSIK